MNKNKLILKGGLMLIALSFIFCIGTAFYLKLDNPVFFKNYREIYLYKTEDGRYQDTDFTLQYLTNSSDTRTVSDIYLKGLPNSDLDFRVSEYGFGGGWWFSSQNNRPGEIIGRYSLRNIYIKIYPSPEKSLDGMEIEDLVINFDNGDILETNIGKIILRDDDAFNRDFLSSDSSSGSSDGTSSSGYLVMKDIDLENLDSPFLENVKDNIEITVDGKDYREIKGLTYELGDRFTIESKWIIPKDIEDKYTSVFFYLNLYFKDKDGSIHETRSHYIDYNYHNFSLNTKDIISYLKSRGAI